MAIADVFVVKWLSAIIGKELLTIYLHILEFPILSWIREQLESSSEVKSGCVGFFIHFIY